VLLRDMMRIAGYHGSGDPSHGQSVLDELRSRQEEFGIVSPEYPNTAGIPLRALLAIGVKRRVSPALA